MAKFSGFPTFQEFYFSNLMLAWSFYMNSYNAFRSN